MPQPSWPVVKLESPACSALDIVDFDALVDALLATFDMTPKEPEPQP